MKSVLLAARKGSHEIWTRIPIFVESRRFRTTLVFKSTIFYVFDKTSLMIIPEGESDAPAGYNQVISSSKTHLKIKSQIFKNILEFLSV